MKNNKVEFLKDILCSDNVVENIKNNFDTLLTIVPQLVDMKNCNHKHPHHIGTVLEHTLSAISFAENDFDIRLVLLLHDMGKPFCYKEIDGVRRFWGHAEKSAEIAKELLSNIGFNNDYIEYVCSLIKLHDTPISKENIISDKPFYSTLFKIQICDALAHNPKYNQKRLQYIENVKKLFEEK